MKRTIWFNMDGTIADLYAVENWLPKLRAEDASPYMEAAVMLNMSLLARYLNKLQKLGYGIGIISWASKDSTCEYNRQVTKAKHEWLKIHLGSVTFNEILITPYGVPKEIWMNTANDILFDDNAEIRNKWNGDAYEPADILAVLKELLRQE